MAMLPGFILPFAVTLVMPTSDGDSYLLAASIAVTLASIVGNAVELNTASEYGRMLGRGAAPSRVVAVQYRRRVFTFAFIAVVSVGSLLILVYGLRTENESLFLTLGVMALFVPLLGAASAMRSGYLIASDRAHVAVALQAPRTLLPLIALLVFPNPSALIVMMAFIAGEAVRLAALIVITRGIWAQESADLEVMQTAGLWWQSSSAAVSQGGPVIDRAFLAPVPGAVSAYELADKLFFTPIQFLNLGFLVPRVGLWSRIPSMTAEASRRMLRRDFTILLSLSLVAGGGAAAGLFLIANAAWFPDEWRQGALWGAILALSLPLSLGIMSCGRLLIIARRQHWLLWFSGITVVLNLAGDAWLFFAVGPIGIPIATVVVRAVSFVAYLIVVARLLPHVWASERSDLD